jgi:hypothetical protein
MATDPEALAQLSRLIGEPLSPTATQADVQRVIENRVEALRDGILAEAAASDDVLDEASALEFVEARLDDLAKWLSEAQKIRLLESIRGKIEAW